MNKANLMDVESYSIPLGASLRGTLLMARKMEEAEQLLLLDFHTMENFKMTCFMDMVSLAFHPILIMKDTTTNNNFMHMDCKHFHLVMYMRVNITMEKCKGMEFT